MRPLATLPLLLLLSWPARAAATPADTAEGWRLASILELGAARAAFAAAPASREHRLGTILARLHEPPFSAARATAARDALAALAAEDGADATGLAARYHLARLHQDYLTPADPVTAARLFAELHAEHPASDYGQHAFIKLCVLRFAAASTPGERAAALAAAEEGGALLPSPEARRAWHLAMAVAHLRLDRRSPDALRHALAADALPGGRSVIANDNLIRIAELAHDLGHADLAVEYYARFAAARPRDARAAYARARIAGLAANLAGPTPSPVHGHATP
jgi:hypothetical protein